MNRPAVACEVCRRKFSPRAGNQRRCADCRFGERLVVTLSRRAVEELEALEKTWNCSRSAVLDRLLRQRSPTMEEAEAEAIAKGWLVPEAEQRTVTTRAEESLEERAEIEAGFADQEE